MLKKVIITGLIAAVLSFGTTFANAGIIILGKDGGNSAKKTSATTTSLASDSGDPCSDSTAATAAGIIILGATGIIILGATDQPTTCGIIILG